MISFFQNGGQFVYVILGVSIVGLALFFERAGYLYLKLKLNMDAAFQKILRHLETSNYRGAIDECTRIENHPLGRILKAGLLKSDKRDKEIELTIEESILKEIPMVKARINYLALLANISTLLGLLGTIFGLIVAFQGVGSASAAMKQEILAKGISIAIFITAFGLLVAIPCLAGFYILNNRSDYLIDHFEEKALKLFNTLTAMKRDREASCPA